DQGAEEGKHRVGVADQVERQAGCDRPVIGFTAPRPERGEGPAHGGEYVVLARRYREKQEHAALGTPVKGLVHRRPLTQVGPQGYRADGRFPARRDHHQTPPVAADQFHPLRRLPQDTDGHGLFLAVELTHPGLPKAQYVRSRLDAGGLEVPGLVSCSPSAAAWSSSQEWGATIRRA